MTLDYPGNNDHVTTKFSMNKQYSLVCRFSASQCTTGYWQYMHAPATHACLYTYVHVHAFLLVCCTTVYCMIVTHSCACSLCVHMCMYMYSLLLCISCWLLGNLKMNNERHLLNCKNVLRETDHYCLRECHVDQDTLQRNYHPVSYSGPLPEPEKEASMML